MFGIWRMLLQGLPLRVSVIQSETTIWLLGKHFLLLVASLYYIIVTFCRFSLEMTAWVFKMGDCLGMKKQTAHPDHRVQGEALPEAFDQASWSLMKREVTFGFCKMTFEFMSEFFYTFVFWSQNSIKACFTVALLFISLESMTQKEGCQWLFRNMEQASPQVRNETWSL